MPLHAARIKEYLVCHWGIAEATAVDIAVDFATVVANTPAQESPPDLVPFANVAAVKIHFEGSKEKLDKETRQVRKGLAQTDYVELAQSQAVKAAESPTFKVPEDIWKWMLSMVRMEMIRERFTETLAQMEEPTPSIGDVLLDIVKSNRNCIFFLEHENPVELLLEMGARRKEPDSKPKATIKKVTLQTANALTGRLRWARRTSERLKKGAPRPGAIKSRGIGILASEVTAYCEYHHPHVKQVVDLVQQGFTSDEIAIKCKQPLSEVDATLTSAIEYLDAIWIPLNFPPGTGHVPVPQRDDGVEFERRLIHFYMRQAEATLRDHRGGSQTRDFPERLRAVYLLREFVPSPTLGPDGNFRPLRHPTIAKLCGTNKTRVQQWLSRADEQSREHFRQRASEDEILRARYALDAVNTNQRGKLSPSQQKQHNTSRRNDALLTWLLDMNLLAGKLVHSLAPISSSPPDEFLMRKFLLWCWWCCGLHPRYEKLPQSLAKSSANMQQFNDTFSQEFQAILQAMQTKPPQSTSSCVSTLTDEGQELVAFYQRYLGKSITKQEIGSVIKEQLQWSSL